MTRKLARIALVAVLSLSSLIVSASPVAAASCGSNHYLYAYNDATEGGGAIVLCDRDYPGAYSPGSSGSFDGPWRFDNGLTVDNKIDVVQFDPTVPPGEKVKFYVSYYLGAGATWIVTKPSGSNPMFRMPTGIADAVSSFAGCGTSCADEP